MAKAEVYPKDNSNRLLASIAVTAPYENSYDSDRKREKTPNILYQILTLCLSN